MSQSRLRLRIPRIRVFENWRILLLLTSTLLFFVLVIFRLFVIQVKDHEHFSVLASEQHRDWVFIPATRGKIYSGDGFPLVDNQLAYLLYAEPPKIEDVERFSRDLAPVLSSSEEEVEEAAGQIKSLVTQDLQWVLLAHRLSPEVKQKIEGLDIAGVGFEEEPKRFYPEGQLAANVLGFVGRDERGQDTGYYGLEGYYDGDLSGQSGKIVQEKDASGEPIPVGGYRKIPAEDGRNLILTLNRSLQFIVERNLHRAVTDYGALGGVVIVMEPQTGAILAMASSPSYDPLDPFPDDVEQEEGATEKNQDTRGVTETDSGPWKIDPIAFTYEPGSVLKALTMSAAIDTNTVRPQTTMVDRGPITVSGYTVDNWDGKHHGEESMIEVLQHSNNIGAAWVAQRLGAEVLRDYFLRFGLGKPTGIDLEGEGTGIVKDLSEWRPIDLVTASFGQGVSLTPLQLVRIFAAIANGGKLVRPFVVSEIHDGERIIEIRPEVVGQPISKKTSEVMVEMLTAAVEGGESKYYNIKTHRVAGKTGTAQIPVGGRYDSQKTNATFVGFLPTDPRFVMLVMLQEPSSSIYAAETAVPLWMNIARELIVYYGIEPDK